MSDYHYRILFWILNQLAIVYHLFDKKKGIKEYYQAREGFGIPPFQLR